MILSGKVLVQSSNKPLILHTDVSQDGLGAVMSHIMENIWLRTPSWICFQNYECGRELLSARQRRCCSDLQPEEVSQKSVWQAVHHCDRSQTTLFGEEKRLPQPLQESIAGHSS